MDKAEYRIKLEQINNLAENGDFKGAAAIADTIEWKRVKSVRTLCMIGEIYEANRRYSDSEQILKYAYRQSSSSKTVLYRLAEIEIRMGFYDEAKKYYQEFEELSPHDTSRYILKYKLLRAQGAPLPEQIEVLREYKEREYTERWAFELARLYKKNGQKQRCIEECDDMILWFAEGKYVTRAMELKMQLEPLSEAQQKRYDNRHKAAIEAERRAIPDDDLNGFDRVQRAINRADEEDYELRPERQKKVTAAEAIQKMNAAADEAVTSAIFEEKTPNVRPGIRTGRGIGRSSDIQDQIASSFREAVSSIRKPRQIDYTDLYSEEEEPGEDFEETFKESNEDRGNAELEALFAETGSMFARELADTFGVRSGSSFEIEKTEEAPEPETDEIPEAEEEKAAEDVADSSDAAEGTQAEEEVSEGTEGALAEAESSEGTEEAQEEAESSEEPEEAQEEEEASEEPEETQEEEEASEEPEEAQEEEEASEEPEEAQEEEEVSKEPEETQEEEEISEETEETQAEEEVSEDSEETQEEEEVSEEPEEAPEETENAFETTENEEPEYVITEPEIEESVAYSADALEPVDPSEAADMVEGLDRSLVEGADEDFDLSSLTDEEEAEADSEETVEEIEEVTDEAAETEADEVFASAEENIPAEIETIADEAVVNEEVDGAAEADEAAETEADEVFEAVEETEASEADEAAESEAEEVLEATDTVEEETAAAEENIPDEIEMIADEAGEAGEEDEAAEADEAAETEADEVFESAEEDEAAAEEAVETETDEVSESAEAPDEATDEAEENIPDEIETIADEAEEAVEAAETALELTDEESEAVEIIEGSAEENTDSDVETAFYEAQEPTLSEAEEIEEIKAGDSDEADIPCEKRSSISSAREEEISDFGSIDSAEDAEFDEEDYEPYDLEAEAEALREFGEKFSEIEREAAEIAESAAESQPRKTSGKIGEDIAPIIYDSEHEAEEAAVKEELKAEAEELTEAGDIFAEELTKAGNVYTEELTGSGDIYTEKLKKTDDVLVKALEKADDVLVEELPLADEVVLKELTKADDISADVSAEDAVEEFAEAAESEEVTAEESVEELAEEPAEEEIEEESAEEEIAEESAEEESAEEFVEEEIAEESAEEGSAEESVEEEIAEESAEEEIEEESVEEVTEESAEADESESVMTEELAEAEEAELEETTDTASEEPAPAVSEEISEEKPYIRKIRSVTEESVVQEIAEGTQDVLEESVPEAVWASLSRRMASAVERMSAKTASAMSWDNETDSYDEEDLKSTIEPEEETEPAEQILKAEDEMGEELESPLEESVEEELESPLEESEAEEVIESVSEESEAEEIMESVSEAEAAGETPAEADEKIADASDETEESAADLTEEVVTDVAVAVEETIGEAEAAVQAAEAEVEEISAETSEDAGEIFAEAAEAVDEFEKAEAAEKAAAEPEEIIETTEAADEAGAEPEEIIETTEAVEEAGAEPEEIIETAEAAEEAGAEPEEIIETAEAAEEAAAEPGETVETAEAAEETADESEEAVETEAGTDEEASEEAAEASEEAASPVDEASELSAEEILKSMEIPTAGADPEDLWKPVVSQEETETLLGRETDESLGLTREFNFQEELRKARAGDITLEEAAKLVYEKAEAEAESTREGKTEHTAFFLSPEEEARKTVMEAAGKEFPVAEREEENVTPEPAEPDEAVEEAEEPKVSIKKVSTPIPVEDIPKEIFADESDEPLTDEAAEDVSDILSAEESSFGRDTNIIEHIMTEPEMVNRVPVLPRKFDDTERKIFSYFSNIPGMQEQITLALADIHNNSGDKTSRAGNVLIIGRQKSGKTKLAEGLMLAVCKDLHIQAAKKAKIIATDLNKKDPAKIVKLLAGGFLLIEGAGSMYDETIEKLSKAMEFRTDGLVVILEDEKRDIRAMLNSHPELAEKFTSTIIVPVFTNDELVTFARTYARENGYKFDELATLALYTLIGENQKDSEPMTVGMVKELVDQAIDHSKSRRFGFRSKNQSTPDGRILLREKDFS